MLNKLFNFIKNYLTKGNPRSVKLKQNIGASFIIKGISIAIGLVKVPVLLSYLDAEKYGVWLTIASIVMWIHHFDLGLGHGLRNRLAEALAHNDIERGKKLVSTAYISLSVVMFFVLIITMPLVFFLDWSKVLNVYTIAHSELVYSVLFVLIMFINRFVFQLISIILKADQRPAISDIYLPIGSFISLILVFVIRIFTEDSLLLACVIISVPPVFILLIGNIYFFKNDYKHFKPSFKNFDRNHLRDIYSLGLKFFLGQMVSLVLFSSQNFILTQIVNPEEVTIFNIAKKFFSLPVTFFMVILTPYWSAITDAYTKKEFGWIKSNMKKLNFVSVIFSVGIIIMLALSDYVYQIWIGDKVAIPFSLSAVFALYNIFIVFLSPYNFFLMGFGKLNVGLLVAGIKLFLFLPVAIPLTNAYGAIGLVLSLILVNSLLNLVMHKIRYQKIVDQKAYGIWNR